MKKGILFFLLMALLPACGEKAYEWGIDFQSKPPEHTVTWYATDRTTRIEDETPLGPNISGHIAGHGSSPDAFVKMLRDLNYELKISSK